MNNDGILNKLFLFLRNTAVLKRVLIAIAVVLLLVLVPSLILLSKNNFKVVQKPLDKTWEMVVSFDTNSEKLTLKKLNLLDKKVKQDNRSAGFSLYELIMYDGSNEAIYRTKINITTALLWDMSIEPPASGSANPPPPEKLETVLYVPFLDKGVKILIKKNNEEILRVDLPKKTGFNYPIIPKVFAQDANQACSPLVVAFVSDGYTDFNKFHQDIDAFKQVFFSTEPYPSQNIFDFRVVDNSQSLGCKSTRSLNCINNPAVVQVANSAHPDASKVIVLVNMPIPSGGPLGVTSGIGGNIAVFPNNDGNITNNTRIVAAHEFLGHAVGLLYDRYVSASSSYGKISGTTRSNCTDNSVGEIFWQGAGSTGVFKGCGNKNNYAPTELTCSSRNSALLSGGNSTTIMSAVGCASTLTFDSVEQYWIRTQVLPLYCGGTAGGGIDGGATTTTTTTSGGTTGGGNPQTPLLQGTVYTDLNGNSVPDTGEGYQGAVVTITGPFNGSATTNNQGKFSFPSLPIGNYTISVVAGSVSFNPSSSFPMAANMIRTADFAISQGTSGGGGGGTGSTCGNGSCEQGETNISCPSDCNTTTGGGTGGGTTGGGATGGGTGTGGNTGTTGPTPTPYTTANCVFDPNCGLNGDKSGIQVCNLKCTVISK